MRLLGQGNEVSPLRASDMEPDSESARICSEVGPAECVEPASGKVSFATSCGCSNLHSDEHSTHMSVIKHVFFNFFLTNTSAFTQSSFLEGDAKHEVEDFST